MKKLILLFAFLAIATAIYAQIGSPGVSNLQTSVSTPQVTAQFSTAYKLFPYNQAVNCSGGAGGPYTLGISGSLPTSITNASGTILSGTPSGSGTSSFTLICKDKNGTTGPSALLGITVYTLSSIAVTPISPTITTTATQQLTATCTWTGGTPFNCSTLVTWAPATFDTGGTINASGLFTAGSTTTGSPYSVTAAWQTVTSPADSVTVSSSTPVVTTSSITDAMINVPYAGFQLQSSGGSGTPTWATSSGGPPTGISLSSLGFISGTCTVAVTSKAWSVTITNTAGTSPAKSLSMTCAPLASIAVTPASPTITSGSAIQLTATGTYTGTSGNLTSTFITQGSSASTAGSQSASNLTGTAIASLSTPAINVTAGQTVLVYVRHSTITATATVTDTGNTNTFTAVANATNANVSAAAEWFIANNATAVNSDVITCHFSPSDSYDVCMVEVASGLATSALDTHVENIDGTSSGTAPSYVASSAGYGKISPSTTSTITVATGASVGANDLIFATPDWDCGPQNTTDVSCQPTQRTFNTISDGGDVFQQVGTEQGLFGSGGFSDTQRLYCAVNTTGAGTKTVTATVNNPSTVGTFIGMKVWAYHNVAAGCPASNWSFTLYLYPPGTANPGSTVNANQGDTVMSILWTGGTIAPTAGSGYTLRNNQGSPDFAIGIEDAVAAAGGTQTVNWTDADMGGSGQWDVALSNSVGGPSTSCNSGTFTTTQAAELILDACTAGAHGLTYTPGSGYILLSTDPNGNSAISGQLVSSIQTAASTAMGISAANDWINNLITLKAASGSGCSWTGNANGVASVSSGGLVTGDSVNTSSVVTISCTVGAIAGSATVTVNPPSITSITVGPSNPTVPQGQTQQFQAVDNLGNNITTSAIWSSSNPAVATITSGGLATACGSCTGTTNIRASSGGVSGTTTLTITATSGAGLLRNCVVTGTNTTSTGSVTACSGTWPPAGYSLVWAQGFEGSANNADESWPATSTVQHHTGNTAGQDIVNHDQAGPYYYVFGNVIPQFTTLDVSYWEYEDTSATMNDEWSYTDITAYDTNGNFMEEMGYGGQPAPNSNYNGPSMTIELAPQTNCPAPSTCQGGVSGITNGFYGSTFNISPGSWHQIETVWHPNTPGMSNGSFAMYRDGILVNSGSGLNLNGTINFSVTNGTVGLRVSGQYTKQLWTSDGTTGGSCQPFLSGQSFELPGGASFSSIAAVCGPLVPSFNRYIDDIVVVEQ